MTELLNEIARTRKEFVISVEQAVEQLARINANLQ